MNDKNIHNVHVVIYSKKMLKQAVSRLQKEGKKVENTIFDDFSIHDNDNLIFHNGVFKVVQNLPVYPCHEVSLNDLMEIVIFEEEQPKELPIGKWYKHDNGEHPNWLVFNGGDNCYGFRSSGFWDDDIENDLPIYFKRYSFIEATPQQVGEALINEAMKRGHEFDNYIYDHRTNILWGNNRDDDGKEEKALFSNGKWAEIIDQPIDKSDKSIGSSISSGGVYDKTLEEKPKIGDICKFWDNNKTEFIIGVYKNFNGSLHRHTADFIGFENAKPLTKQEAIELLFGKDSV